MIKIGIEATNLNLGGGKSHIVSILNSDYFKNQNDVIVYIWARKDLLDYIDDNEKIIKCTNSLINSSLLKRYTWLFFKSFKTFLKKIDILFVPGGLYIGSFRPFITMSRNMLLYEKDQIRTSNFRLKLKIILSSILQKYSFRKCNGLIFISKYAKDIITKEINIKNFEVINHGISSRFFNNRTSYALEGKIKILYVSHMYPYKNFDKVISAAALLKQKGYDLELHLVGGGDIKTVREVKSAIKKNNKYFTPFIYNHGIQDYKTIQSFYKSCDLFVYASTCENMPNILIEAMSAGLPIASSSKMPMPEFLEEAGLYFNANDMHSIANCLEEYILSEKLRITKGQMAYNKALNYSWEATAKKTFEYIMDTYIKSK